MTHGIYNVKMHVITFLNTMERVLQILFDTGCLFFRLLHLTYVTIIIVIIVLRNWLIDLNEYVRN
jgi:hypothetical protein